MFAIEAGEDEGIDGITDPGWVGCWREGWPFGGEEGPVFLPGGSGFDPLFDEGDLIGWEGVVTAVGGRHAEGFIFGDKTLVQRALGGLTGDDGFGFGGGIDIEAEVGLTVGIVGAVAGETAVREDGTDVAIELDCACLGRGDGKDGDYGFR